MSILSIEDEELFKFPLLLYDIWDQLPDNDENQQKIAQEQKSEEELKKENFNNKFALYEGEDLELEYVKKLLKTVGQNMSDYKVITGTQMRIYIKEGEKNEEMANKIWWLCK